MRRKKNLFDYLNIFLMLFFILLIIYPFLHMLASSLSKPFYVMQGSVSIYPKGFTLKSYVYMLSNNRIPLAYYNTLKYTILGTVLNVFMTMIAAYPLSKKDLFGRNFFLRMIVITLVFYGGLIPNYLVVVHLGMMDSLWAMILPTAISGLYLIMAMTFYITIPNELQESAFIDGASCYRVLFSIMIPLSKSLMAALILFYSMYHYNNYIGPLIYLNSTSKWPLQIVLSQLIIAQGNENPIAEAAGGYSKMSDYSLQSLKYATIFISIIPIMVVYPFIQKQFIKGVMLGAIKG